MSQENFDIKQKVNEYGWARQVPDPYNNNTKNEEYGDVR